MELEAAEWGASQVIYHSEYISFLFALLSGYRTGFRTGLKTASEEIESLQVALRNSQGPRGG